jgi:hypothetical protein
VHQALELGFGLFHGSIEIRDLGGNLGGVFEGLGFAQTEDRFHSVSHAHDHPRTDTDAFMHDKPIEEISTRQAPDTRKDRTDKDLQHQEC